jgi:hypothetical protein
LGALLGIAVQRWRARHIVVFVFAIFLSANFLHGFFFTDFLLDFIAAKYRVIGSK